MAGVAVSVLVIVVVGVCAGTTNIVGAEPAAAARGQYQVVKVCSLLTVSEVKKLAPWEPMFDQMKVEEEAFSNGSSCNCPTATVQVSQFRQTTIDALGKGAKLESCLRHRRCRLAPQQSEPVRGAAGEGRPTPPHCTKRHLQGKDVSTL